jgi:hypothetical protein
MLHSRGLGRLMNPRRISLTLGTAAGAAFAAALIGLANAPAARADTDLDPFQDLFGDTGINTWTPSADSFLASSDPTGALAGNFDTSVESFITAADSGYSPDATFSELTYAIDPNSFSPDSEFLFNSCVGCDITPLDANGDLALALDYSIFASGLSSTVDPLVIGLAQLAQLPQELLAFLVILGIPFGV